LCSPSERDILPSAATGGGETQLSISQSLLPEYDIEMANTRKILQLVPESQFAYKPHQKSMSLGRLAGHVAELPGWTKDTMEKEVLNLGSDMKPYQPASLAELLTKFDQHVAVGRELLANASDADFMVNWTMNFEGNPIVSMPRVSVIRTWVMNHTIHHRAQLGVYLRLNDVEFPGMYGPSADEMKFWEPKAVTTA
jgi:uncharacterized damage-inducible protein DinB